MKAGGLQKVAAAAGVALLLSTGAAFAKAPTPKDGKPKHAITHFSKHKAKPDSIQTRKPLDFPPKSHAYNSYLEMVRADQRQAPQEEIEQAKHFERVFLTNEQLDTLRNAFLNRVKFLRGYYGLKSMPIPHPELTARSQKFADTLVLAPKSLYGHLFAADVMPHYLRLTPITGRGKRDTSLSPVGVGECLAMQDSLPAWGGRLPSMNTLAHQFDQLAIGLEESFWHRLILLSCDTTDRYCGLGVAVCWEHKGDPTYKGSSAKSDYGRYRIVLVYDVESTFDATAAAQHLRKKD